MKIQFESNHLVVFESVLFRTTSTLLIAEDHLLLIDPNWFPIELDFIRNYIAALPGDRQGFLLYTHSDYDHIIGFHYFRDWTMIASSAFVNQANKEEIIDKIVKLDDDNYVKRKHKVSFPVIDIEIDVSSTELTLGNTIYKIGYAFGHNDDSIYLFEPRAGVLVVGDYLSNIEFPYIYHSFSEYLQTLEKFKSIISTGQVIYLISGHGDFTDEVVNMHDRLVKSNQYIHDLITCFKEGKTFPFDTFVQEYDFPIVMQEFHKANLRLLESQISEL